MECVGTALFITLAGLAVVIGLSIYNSRRIAVLEAELRAVEHAVRRISAREKRRAPLEDVVSLPSEVARADAPPLAQHKAAPEAPIVPTPPQIEPAVASPVVPPTPAPAEPMPPPPPEVERPTSAGVVRRIGDADREPQPPVPPQTAPPTPQRVGDSGFELQFTTKVAIWLGAIALFLAGAFLVKYTFDAGLLGPKVRLILGAAFGVALLGAGEFMRRRSARIGEGLTAAGVADLYAVVLAALNLYHFVGPTLGFALLAAITAAAIALSLRQGPFVALLGLIGGFVTPALIGVENPTPGPLFIYLLLLQGGIAAISRQRRWWPLSVLSFAGGIVWVTIWLAVPTVPFDHTWLAAFLVLSLALMLAAGPDARVVGVEAARAIRVIASIVGLGALGFVVRASGFTAIEWGFVGLLSAASIIVAWWDRRHEPLPWLAFALGGILLAVWRLEARSVDATLFPWVALGYGLVFGAGAYSAVWRSHAPERFATLSVGGGLAALLISYWALAAPPAGVPWGIICAVTAAAYALAAAPLIRPAIRARIGDEALAAMLVATTAFASLAVPIEFERRLIPVAWAIEAALLALLFAWLRVQAVRLLSILLAGLALVALVTPEVLRLSVGPTPIWNWLLYAYGVPAVAFASAAIIYHRIRDVRFSQVFQAGTALLLFLLVTLEVRHYFNRESLFAPSGGLFETATYVNAWLVLALVAALATRDSTRLVSEAAAKVLALSAVAAATLGLVLFQNPLWTDVAVGSLRIWNTLLPTYGVPAALLLVAAFVLRSGSPRELIGVIAAAGVVLFFLLVSLETRQWFHGARLNIGGVTLLELAGYANAWLLVALATTRLTSAAIEPVARYARIGFGGAALVIAGAGLLAVRNPLFHGESVGALPIVNWLLVAYGVPTALMLALAAAARRMRPARFPALFAGAGLAMLFALTMLETRQWFHGARLDLGGVTLLETAGYVMVWLAVALATTPLSAAALEPVARYARIGFGGAALVFAGVGLVILRNPLVVSEPVGGGLIFNWLLVAYGAPMFLMFMLAAATRDARPPRFAISYAVAALMLLFVLTTLQVRQWFRGPILVGPFPVGAELYAYSAAWTVLGLGLLAAGVVSGSLVARWASPVVMLAVVGKVFLVDTSHLRDLYRVVSLFGLGLSLMVLALVYQKVVFRKSEIAAGGSAGG